jgi:hypothetical protein
MYPLVSCWKAKAFRRPGAFHCALAGNGFLGINLQAFIHGAAAI